MFLQMQDELLVQSFHCIYIIVQIWNDLWNSNTIFHPSFVISLKLQAKSTLRTILLNLKKYFIFLDFTKFCKEIISYLCRYIYAHFFLNLSNCILLLHFDSFEFFHICLDPPLFAMNLNILITSFSTYEISKLITCFNFPKFILYIMAIFGEKLKAWNCRINILKMHQNLILYETN